MNYAMYTHIIKGKLKMFKTFRFVSEMFENIWFVLMYVGVLGVFYTINCYFEYRIRILCIFLYMEK